MSPRPHPHGSSHSSSWESVSSSNVGNPTSMTDIRLAHFKDVLLKKRKTNQTKIPTQELLVLRDWEQLRSVGRVEPGRQKSIGSLKPWEGEQEQPFPRAQPLSAGPGLIHLEKTGRGRSDPRKRQSEQFWTPSGLSSKSPTSWEEEGGPVLDPAYQRRARRRGSAHDRERGLTEAYPKVRRGTQAP